MNKNREREKNNLKKEKIEQLLYLSLIFLLCLIFSALLIVEIIVNRFTQNERVKLAIVTISCLLSTIILGIGIVFALREK